LSRKRRGNIEKQKGVGWTSQGKDDLGKGVTGSFHHFDTSSSRYVLSRKKEAH